MFPARAASALIALILSGAMSFLVSGVATYRALGLPDDFLSAWLSAWVLARAIAFPTLFVLRPLVTKLVMGFVSGQNAS